MLRECRTQEVHHWSGGVVHTSSADAPKVGEAVLFDGRNSGEHGLIVDDDHGDDHEQCHGNYDDRPPLQRPHQPVACCLRGTQDVLARMVRIVSRAIPCCLLDKLRMPAASFNFNSTHSPHHCCSALTTARGWKPGRHRSCELHLANDGEDEADKECQHRVVSGDATKG